MSEQRLSRRDFLKLGGGVAVCITAALEQRKAAAASNCINYLINPGDTLLEIARRFNTTVKGLLADNPYVTDADRIYTGKRLTVCPPGGVGGFYPADASRLAPPSPDAASAAPKPGSGPENLASLENNTYHTFAPGESLWVKLGPGQLDEQHNRLGPRVEVIAGRPDEVRGYIYAPDRIPAVTAWFKTQGDRPGPTAAFAKISNNPGEERYLGAETGNLWFRDSTKGEYLPWLLHLQNAGNQPITLRYWVTSYFQQ
jgi:hypothetical protein